MVNHDILYWYRVGYRYLGYRGISGRNGTQERNTRKEHRMIVKHHFMVDRHHTTTVCPHTTLMCPHTVVPLYVSSYYLYICV